MDAISIARGGAAAAERRFAAAADRIVQGSAAGDADLAQGMVELVQAKHQFTANLQVIRFADQMWRALLEVQQR